MFHNQNRFEFKLPRDYDLHKYLPRHIMFKDCLEPDVYDMTSQILSVLIDFNKDWAVPCTVVLIGFWIFSATLKLEKILRNSKRQSFNFEKTFRKDNKNPYVIGNLRKIPQKSVLCGKFPSYSFHIWHTLDLGHPGATSFFEQSRLRNSFIFGTFYCAFQLLSKSFWMMF